MNPERDTDWSDRAANLCTIAVQVITALVILEHSGWHVRQKWERIKQEYRRWSREREFELFYEMVWKHRPGRREPSE